HDNSDHAAGHVNKSTSAVTGLDRSRYLKEAGIILHSAQGCNISQRTVTAGGQDAGVGKAIGGHLVANAWLRLEGGCRKIVHIGLQQSQIIIGVLTRYCCSIRPPVWISHLNGFCASAHHVMVRHHAICCNEETSSGYRRLWFWRRATARRVLIYTVHDRANGGSTIFHVDSGQQRPVLILDLHLRRIGHAVHEFDGCTGG